MGNTTAQLAEVLAVDEVNRTVTVQTKEDGFVLPPISLDNPQFSQYIPVPGQQLLIGDVFNTDLRVLAIFGSEAGNIQRSKPISQGEILSMGSGGGFFYADKAGSAMLADKNLANVIQLLVNDKIGMAGKTLFININGVGQIKITPADPDDSNSESTIEIIKVSGEGKIVANITIKNDIIEVSGDNVSLGQEPIASAVVTLSPAKGVYSFDSFGIPIPGSSTVTSSV